MSKTTATLNTLNAFNLIAQPECIMHLIFIKPNENAPTPKGQ